MARVVEKSLSLANWISGLRILLIPAFLTCLVQYSPEKEYFRWWAIGLFGLAMATDLIDGLVARVLSERTKIGGLLDPVADKLLITGSFITLYFIAPTSGLTSLPSWMLALVVSRDLMLIIGAVLIYIIVGSLQVRPTLAGKVTTFLQMISVAAIVVDFPWTGVLLIVMSAFTLISGIEYLVQGVMALSSNAYQKVGI